MVESRRMKPRAGTTYAPCSQFSLGLEQRERVLGVLIFTRIYSSLMSDLISSNDEDNLENRVIVLVLMQPLGGGGRI